MNTQYSVDVDAGLISVATDELFKRLWTQRLVFIGRFEILKPVESILRVVGLALSVLGLLLCAAAAYLTPDWCPAWLEVRGFVPAFLALFLIFYYLPKLDKYRRRWVEGASRRQCERYASRCMSQLKALVPLTVEYEFESDMVICYRCKEGQRTKAWERRLSGIMYQGSTATLFFKKRNSLYPKTILIHRNPTILSNLLKELPVVIVTA